MKLTVVLLLVMFLTACGGGNMSSPSSPSTPSTPSNPPTAKQRDPQGNWRFVLTDANNNILIWGQELFELAPPVVTSSQGIGFIGPYAIQNSYNMNTNGTVTGTDTMNFTVTARRGQNSEVATLTLTGTIAPDEHSISNGTWTADQSLEDNFGIFPGTSGTWTARLLPPLTGDWAGTLTAADNSTITVALSLTEDTSQTSPNLGTVSGTANVTNSPCFDPAVALVFDPVNMVGQSLHLGQYVSMATSGTPSLVIATGWQGVDPDTTIMNLDSEGGLIVQGGPCDGMVFYGTIGRQ